MNKIIRCNRKKLYCIECGKPVVENEKRHHLTVISLSMVMVFCGIRCLYKNLKRCISKP